MAQQRINLLTMEPEALQAWVREQEMPPYRARQILRWVYERGETSFARMTDLPRADRHRLEWRRSGGRGTYLHERAECHARFVDAKKAIPGLRVRIERTERLRLVESGRPRV